MRRHHFERRLFITGAGALGASSVFAPSVVRAQEVRELRMVTAWPKDSAGLGVNAQRLADMIGTMSGGRLRVRVFAAGELVPALQVFDAVSDGRAELSHATPHFAAGRDASFRFFGNVPFGLTAHEHAAWLRFGGGQELWNRSIQALRRSAASRRHDRASGGWLVPQGDSQP